MSAAFGVRLQQAVAAHGPVVAGIDPHASLLAAWGLPDGPSGLREMSLRTLEAVAGSAAAIKPQSAFFERHGAAGIAVLEELLATARERGVLSILDAKRGDIGSTMGGYAEAYLRPGAPTEVDAITLSPYLGFASLAPALDLAAEHGKGAFVLALTSNPEGREVQHAHDAQGAAVARTVLEHAAARDAHVPAGTWGDVGVVIGATTGEAVRELGLAPLLEDSPVPVLSPGFGAQGAGPRELHEVFGPAAPRVLVSVSRALLGAGPDPRELAARAHDLRSVYSDGTFGTL